MKISLKKLSAAMALGGCVALSSGTAQAFLDGSVGATSQGQVDVTVIIPSLIIIDNITSDITLNFVTGGVEQNISFCVHGILPSTSYEVALTSASGAMTLPDGTATNFLPYSASYDGDNNATLVAGGGLPLAYGVPTTSTFPLTPGLGACAVDNASFAVQVTDLMTAGVPAGTYADTINLTVTPN